RFGRALERRRAAARGRDLREPPVGVSVAPSEAGSARDRHATERDGVTLGPVRQDEHARPTAEPGDRSMPVSMDEFVDRDVEEFGRDLAHYPKAMETPVRSDEGE